MKTKRILAAALCALLAAGWLAGCSTETGGGESRLEDTTINGEEAKDLKYIRPGQNADNENDPVIRAIRAYENLYGVKVDVIAADYDTWTTKVLAASTSGSPIDVIYGSVSEYPLFAMKGYTQPIEEYVDLSADYLNASAAEAFFSFQGKVYCAAGSTVAPLVMYYNKDMLEAEGMDDPIDLYNAGEWTFDNFRKMCKALTTDTDGDGNTDRWGLCCWYPWAFLGANHTALCTITEEGKYQLNLDDPAVVETLEFVQDAYYTSKWRGLDGDNIYTSFYQGRNAFLNEYSWSETSNIIPAKESGQFDFEYGVAPMPTGPNNTEGVSPITAAGWAIGNGSDCPAHTGKLIDMLVDGQAAYIAKTNESLDPAHVELYQTLAHYFEETDPKLFKPVQLTYKVKAPQPATPKQISFLSSLIQKRGVKMEWDPKTLTRSEASRMIDGLLKG